MSAQENSLYMKQKLRMSVYTKCGIESRNHERALKQSVVQKAETENEQLNKVWYRKQKPRMSTQTVGKENR